MNAGGVRLAALALGLVAAAPQAEAQQAAKVPRIGLMSPGSASAAAQSVAAFRQGLRDLGHADGQKIVVESRYAKGRPDRLPALAAELVRLKVDLLVAAGIRAIRAATQASRTIPIVVPYTIDLVGTGLAAGLARPGGTVTGLTAMSPELTGKRLELLKEVLAKVSRVAILRNSVQGKDLKWGPAQAAAQALAVKLQSVQVRDSDDFPRALDAMIREHANALLTLNDGFISNHRRRISDLAAKHRLPAMYELREFVDEGGLISYGPHVPDMWRRAATYVDKILKGVRPADLPVDSRRGSSWW